MESYGEGPAPNDFSLKTSMDSTCPQVSSSTKSSSERTGQ
jgi:hypothetical protein